MNNANLWREIDRIKKRLPKGFTSDGRPVYSSASGGTGGSDAAAVTYTPVDNSDWSGSADPGNTDDALDQLADRLRVVEGTLVGSGTTDDVFVLAAAVAL